MYAIRSYYGEIFNTAVAVTKERRNHPSFIQTEGGEEMLLRTRDAHFGRAFLEELGDSIKKYNNIPYVDDSRITSYNVCYTKLLRHKVGYHIGQVHEVSFYKRSFCIGLKPQLSFPFIHLQETLLVV